MAFQENGGNSKMIASTSFIWTPPDGQPTEFVVTLYSTNVVGFRAPGSLNGLVMPLEWSDERQAIISGGGFWKSDLNWDAYTKNHLMLKATNALRKALGLPLHSMTASWPGTE